MTGFRVRVLMLAACIAVQAGGCVSTGNMDRTPEVAAPHARMEEPRVDARVELLAVVFRLARVDGYTMMHFPGYVAAMDAHFGAFREHPAVLEARRLRDEHGVAWDAPMSLAVHLTALPELALRRDLEGMALDERWPREATLRFIELVRDFARDADFPAFHASQRALHAEAEARLAAAVREHVSLAWFDEFFREAPSGPFRVLIGLSNGGAHYYTRFMAENGTEENYAVISVESVDGAGAPVFGEAIIPTVIHEFVHAYVNPLVDRYEAALRPGGEAMHAASQAQLYPRWDLTVKESLVRAVVARHTQDARGAAAAVALLDREKEIGYAWMDELSATLGLYATSPALYPSFSGFVAGLGPFLVDLGRRAPTLVEQFDRTRRPHLLYASVPSGADGVDPGITSISFHFDRPMDPRHFPMVGPADQWPGSGAQSFDESGLVLTLPVSLKPNTTYSFYLGHPGGFGWQDRSGIRMRAFPYRFRTGPGSEHER
jgi:hypothetical protein